MKSQSTSSRTLQTRSNQSLEELGKRNKILPRENTRCIDIVVHSQQVRVCIQNARLNGNAEREQALYTYCCITIVVHSQALSTHCCIAIVVHSQALHKRCCLDIVVHSQQVRKTRPNAKREQALHLLRVCARNGCVPGHVEVLVGNVVVPVCAAERDGCRFACQKRCPPLNDSRQRVLTCEWSEGVSRARESARETES